MIAFKFRLYPTKKQERRMLKVIEACRKLWNISLDERKWRWESAKLSTTCAMQQEWLPEKVKENLFLGAVHSQVRQDVLRRLDKAFMKFFNEAAGYPKFKKFSETGSFTYPQAYNGSVKLLVERKRLHLSMIGDIRVVAHREVPATRMKTCTVIHEPDGRWFASLVYEEVVPLQGLSVPASWKAPIGVDRGLVSVIATSDGEKIEAPKFFRKGEDKLAALQRNMSRKQKGSKNRKKAKVKVARQHSHVANQREDFNHKVSTHLVRRHSFIAFEDLSINNMMRNNRLAKSISDAGLAQLSDFTEYKMRKKGGVFVKAPAAYSTQDCWFCGTRNKVPLDVRAFMCIGCGMILDRDINSGRVVLDRGVMVALEGGNDEQVALAREIAKVGQDSAPSERRAADESHPRLVPELTPAETGENAVEEAGTIRLQRLEAHRFISGRMSLANGLQLRVDHAQVPYKSFDQHRTEMQCLNGVGCLGSR